MSCPQYETDHTWKRLCSIREAGDPKQHWQQCYTALRKSVEQAAAIANNGAGCKAHLIHLLLQQVGSLWTHAPAQQVVLHVVLQSLQLVHASSTSQWAPHACIACNTHTHTRVSQPQIVLGV